MTIVVCVVRPSGLCDFDLSPLGARVLDVSLCFYPTEISFVIRANVTPTYMKDARCTFYTSFDVGIERRFVPYLISF